MHYKKLIYRRDSALRTPRTHKYKKRLIIRKITSSAIAERPRELGDFKGVGHFEAKF